MKFRFRILGLSALVFSSVLMVASAAQAQRSRGSTNVWKFLSEKYDKDGDGKLTTKEYDRSKEKFKGFDKNDDGVLTAEDWKTDGDGRGGRRSRGGSSGTAPAKGDVAPDFDLSMVTDKSKTVKLSSFAGEKPVALVFGSCT